MIEKKDSKLKEIIYKAEYQGLRFAFKIFSILDLRFISFLASVFAIIIGSFTFPSFLAFRNIKRAMPKLSNFRIMKIVIGMWGNLGSYIAEYGNVYNKKFDIFDFAKVSKQSRKTLEEIKKDKKGAILFSGHIGNWEVGLRVLKELGVPVKTVYRPLNNPFADKFINDFRKSIGVDMIAKGGRGAIQIARELKKGTKIVMLVDQRLSNGVVVPFFGRKAQTTDAVGIFALKYKIPVYPVRVIRKDMFSNFEFCVEEKMKITKKKYTKENIIEITKLMNKKLEEWIKEYPEQWFWVHDRWKM